MKKLFGDSLDVNILEILVVVLFLVGSIWGFVSFPGRPSVLCMVFIVGGAVVAYFSGRTDKIYYIDRRDGIKSLTKYCLHLLWVLPALWCMGSALRWALAQPYGLSASLLTGVDLVVIMLIVYCIIKGAVGLLSIIRQKQKTLSE